MTALTPTQLLHRHLDTVLARLPGVLDGNGECIHDARIATRRLREVLPLVTGVEHVAETIRAAGRQLGRVREIDVMSGLLDSLSDRLPVVAAAEFHLLRQVVHQQAHDARRVMVKALEKLDLPALREAFATNRQWLPLSRGLAAIHFGRPSWAEPIWMRIMDRTTEAVSAVGRAPAVYLPNRTHDARIAVKKLRYAIEVAADTRVWNPPRVLKDLRRIQGILGEEHDRQVLVDFVGARAAEGTGPPETSVISSLLIADIRRLHAEYARRRSWVFQIAKACARAAAHRGWRMPRPLVAATVFTAPLVMESLRPQRRLLARE